MIFIKLGDPPMSERQAIKRGLNYFEMEKSQWQREQGLFTSDESYKEFAERWIQDNRVNTSNNVFNHMLHHYKMALLRLERYKLSEGKPAVVDQETNEIIEEAISPVQDKAIKYYDDEEEKVKIRYVKHDSVIRDETERSQAQAVIDNTPEMVKSFYNQGK